jgi:hypothetical protein
MKRYLTVLCTFIMSLILTGGTIRFGTSPTGDPIPIAGRIAGEVN